MSTRVETGAGAKLGRPPWSASQANASDIAGIGELFRTFEEAWAAFLRRTEPLESFYEQLPEDESATLDIWLIEPSPAVKAAAAGLQRALAQLAWIVPTPPHFLHVTVGHGEDGVPAGVGPFEIDYGGVNCFHEAVIAEVSGSGPPALARSLGADGPYLPHLTLGYGREPASPRDLQRILPALRSSELGSQRVEEVLLCRVPASRTTVLEPWTVLERVRLTAGL